MASPWSGTEEALRAVGGGTTTHNSPKRLPRLCFETKSKGRGIKLNRRRRKCDKLVYEEKDFQVFLLNNGKKLMPNPVPLNPRSETVPCLVSGCPNVRKNMWGICGEHMRGKMTLGRLPHLADWNGRIKAPQGDYIGGTEEAIAGHGEIAETLLRWTKRKRNEREEREAIADDLVSSLLRSTPGKFEDASTFQLKHEDGDTRVEQVAKSLRKNVLRRFKGVIHPGWVRWNGKQENPLVPIRVVAALLATAYAAEEINRGDLY